MGKLNIELLGSEVLRQKAVEVPSPGPELDRLIADMFETMYDAGGIGLAAPQVGLSQRLIVVDVKEEGTTPFALLDPRVVESGAELEKMEEGCLSIPGVSGVVERPYRVVVEGTDPAGKPVRIEGDEMLGRCLQHEIDHLDGILFIDRLSPLKRNMVLRRYK
ncbi:MAG TPA: peptide deformylase, partial [Longimicrobiaceae bacterium]|nr:peptide deformylase [Longimicrobiaceae bacterium]